MTKHLNKAQVVQLHFPQGLITTLLYVAQQPAAIVPLLAMLCSKQRLMVRDLNGASTKRSVEAKHGTWTILLIISSAIEVFLGLYVPWIFCG